MYKTKIEGGQIIMAKLKPITVLLLCLCMIFFIGCEDQRQTARDEKLYVIHTEFEEVTGREINRVESTITSNLCEGSRVAASMMLSEVGKSSDLSDYSFIEFSEVFDTDGNLYPIVTVDGEVIIPDRYKLD